MSLTLSPVARQQFFDNSGNPVSGGYLYTYEAGTTTAQATYADDGQVTANTNPIELNSAGRPTTNGSTECGIYLLPTGYKFVLKDSAGATIWTQDDVLAVPAASVDTDVSAEAGENITVGDVVYWSDGSGGNTAGLVYKADADLSYASLTPEIGLAVATIASGASGTVRIAGRMTGLSALTPGALYYVSGTAGELTATAPGNARFVGQADSISSLIISANPPVASTTGTADNILANQVFS